MAQVEEIEQAIKNLPVSELKRFRRWFFAFDSEVWDAQIEADAASGKSDASAAAATDALLSRDDRSRLILHLLQSIEERPATDPHQVEAAWLAEADRRYQAYLRGDEQAIPADVVFEELRADDF